MDRSEVQELFGKALDGTLPPAVQREFDAALARFPEERTAFELEHMARSIVRTHLKHTPCPLEHRTAVLAALRNEAAAPPARRGFIATLFGGRTYAPAIAIAVIVIAALTVLLIPRTQAPLNVTPALLPNDVVFQSFNNYALLRKGSLKPQMTTTEHTKVPGFFTPYHLPFRVHVVPMKSCTWYGAVYSEYSGVKLAHIVYKIGEELMYVYEVGKTEALNGTTLAVCEAARKKLDAGGWYVTSNETGCTLVLWETDGIICAAVSTMNAEKMMGMLRGGYQS